MRREGACDDIAAVVRCRTVASITISIIPTHPSTSSASKDAPLSSSPIREPKNAYPNSKPTDALAPQTHPLKIQAIAAKATAKRTSTQPPTVGHTAAHVARHDPTNQVAAG